MVAFTIKTTAEDVNELVAKEILGKSGQLCSDLP